MRRYKSSALAEDFTIRTEGEAALEEKMETVKRGKPVRQPSKERPGYEQGREVSTEESRLNKSGSVY